MSFKKKNIEEVINKPTAEEAQDAVRTLIQWLGENPDREGLLKTPSRVVKAYKEWFAGYEQDPIKFLESNNIENILEIGPNNVLNGLNKRISNKFILTNVSNIQELEDLKNVL